MKPTKSENFSHFVWGDVSEQDYNGGRIKALKLTIKSIDITAPNGVKLEIDKTFSDSDDRLRLYYEN